MRRDDARLAVHAAALELTENSRCDEAQALPQPTTPAAFRQAPMPGSAFPTSTVAWLDRIPVPLRRVFEHSHGRGQAANEKAGTRHNWRLWPRPAPRWPTKRTQALASIRCASCFTRSRKRFCTGFNGLSGRYIA